MLKANKDVFLGLICGASGGMLGNLLHRLRGHFQSAVSYASGGSLAEVRERIVHAPLPFLIPLSEAARRESYER